MLEEEKVWVVWGLHNTKLAEILFFFLWRDAKKIEAKNGGCE